MDCVASISNKLLPDSWREGKTTKFLDKLARKRLLRRPMRKQFIHEGSRSQYLQLLTVLIFGQFSRTRRFFGAILKAFKLEFFFFWNSQNPKVIVKISTIKVNITLKYSSVKLTK